jgi:hypothetical protein
MGQNCDAFVLACREDEIPDEYRKHWLFMEKVL